MTNPHFTKSGSPASGSRGKSAPVRSEVAAEEARFDSVENLKANKASPTFTGTVTLASLLATGTVDLDGATIVTVPALTITEPDMTKAAPVKYVLDVLGAAGALIPPAAGHDYEVLMAAAGIYSWQKLPAAYLAVNTNTTVDVTKKGALIDASGSINLGFDAPANLKSNFWVRVRNGGTGNITMTSTVDGSTGWVMYPGEVRDFNGDGASIRSVVISPFHVTFTASGNFIKPPGYSFFAGMVWGGGGSGQKSGSIGTASNGGGGGACVPFELPTSAFASTEVVTVDSGGAAVTGTASGNSGGPSSIGSVVISYGGAGGTPTGGGGGGGTTGAPTTVTGGAPTNGTGNGSLTFGGAIGNQTDERKNSFYGGGAGSSGAASTNGSSFWGAAGGGALTSLAAQIPAGTSKYGGAGGAGNSATDGGDGAAPGGGGGATQTGSKSGAGARGEVRIRGIV